MLARARRLFVRDLTDAMVQLRIVTRLRSRVAQEALFLLQMGDDAEALAPSETARGRGLQTILAADQQIAGGRVAGALVTGVLLFGGPVGCDGVCEGRVIKGWQ